MINLDDLKEIAQRFFHVDEKEANEIIANLTSDQKQVIARMYKAYQQAKGAIEQEFEAAKRGIKAVEAEVSGWFDHDKKE